MVRRTDEGLTYEADTRQAEKFIQEFGLEGAKPVASLCVQRTQQQVASDQRLLEQKASHFRGVAARANYIPRVGPPGHPVLCEGDLQVDAGAHRARGCRPEAVDPIFGGEAQDWCSSTPGKRLAQVRCCATPIGLGASEQES